MSRKTRLKCYEMSFFPSTFRVFQQLPSEVLLSKTSCEFKIRLNKIPMFQNAFDQYDTSYLFEFCSGYYGRILNQIRYKLSPIRSHLFAYCITDNPMCPNCFNNIETPKHFFLVCDSYRIARSVLLIRLSEILPDAGMSMLVNADEVLVLILFGVQNKTMSVPGLNRFIFLTVRTFMSESKRFVKKEQ